MAEVKEIRPGNVMPSEYSSAELKYEPNSHKYKKEKAEQAAAEHKKIEKVVTGKVKTKKKSELVKFADVFISEDASNVKSYILMDVLVPAVKKAISDIVTNGIDMILYGGTGKDKRTTVADRFSYSSVYDNNHRSTSGVRTQTRIYDDLVFPTRGDAEAVREQMECILEQYGVVKVSDMYELAEVTAPYTANKYGWTNLSRVELYHARDGYILKMPKAMPID